MVNPGMIRAPQLTVREGVGGIPLGDLRSPTEWDALESEPVVDQGSPTHLDGKGREDPEVEFRGCDALEVTGVREELKDLLNGKGEFHGRFEPAEAPDSRPGPNAFSTIQSHIPIQRPTVRWCQVGYQKNRATEATP